MLVHITTVIYIYIYIPLACCGHDGGGPRLHWKLMVIIVISSSSSSSSSSMIIMLSVITYIMISIINFRNDKLSVLYVLCVM